MNNKSRKALLVWLTEDAAREWAFMTNHTRVLICIAHDPSIRLRDQPRSRSSARSPSSARGEGVPAFPSRSETCLNVLENRERELARERSGQTHGVAAR